MSVIILIDGIVVNIKSTFLVDNEYLLDYTSESPLSDEQEEELQIRFALQNINQK